MFKNQYKQKYEEQEHIKKILFLICPKLKFMYNDIEKLLKQNYPLKNIVILMKDKYNV
jgi:cellobiose-specific phosphotransferase system component IIB